MIKMDWNAKSIDNWPLSNLGGSVEPRLLLVDKKCVRHPDQLDVVRSYHQLLKPVLNAKINNKNKNCNACNFQHLYIFFYLNKDYAKKSTFYRTQVSLGSGLWVLVSLTPSKTFGWPIWYWDNWALPYWHHWYRGGVFIIFNNTFDVSHGHRPSRGIETIWPNPMNAHWSEKKQKL